MDTASAAQSKPKVQLEYQGFMLLIFVVSGAVIIATGRFAADQRGCRFRTRPFDENHTGTDNTREESPSGIPSASGEVPFSLDAGTISLAIKLIEPGFQCPDFDAHYRH